LIFIQERLQLLSHLLQAGADLLSGALHGRAVPLRGRRQDRVYRLSLRLVPGLDQSLELHREPTLPHLGDPRRASLPDRTHSQDADQAAQQERDEEDYRRFGLDSHSHGVTGQSLPAA
jgi:hypothetical protein